MKIFAHGSTIFHDQEPASSLHTALTTSCADVAEIDVRRSLRGTLFCHDSSEIQSVKIAEAGDDELKQRGALDIHSVMELAKKVDTPLLFDIKPGEPDMPETILNCARGHDIDDNRLIIGVRDLAQAGNAQAHGGKAGILGFLERNQLPEYLEIVGQGRYFRLWERDSTQDNITAVRKAGLLPVTMTGYRGQGPDKDFVKQYFNGDDFPEPGETARSMLATAFNRCAYAVMVNNPQKVRQALESSNDNLGMARSTVTGAALPAANEPVLR